jgi:hypothetical protein
MVGVELVSVVFILGSLLAELAGIAVPLLTSLG